MKTKDEILDHLLKNGYSEQAMAKIAGFMIGKGLKTNDEIVLYKKGYLTFDDFWHWLVSEDKSKDDEVDIKNKYSILIIDSLIDDVIENVFNHPNLMIPRYEIQLDFLNEIKQLFKGSDKD